MRDFEDYSWRDLVDDEVRYIYTPYVRERAVGRRPGLIVVHPTTPVAGRWGASVQALLQEARRRGIPVVHSGNPAAANSGEPVCALPCERACFSTTLERT